MNKRRRGRRPGGFLKGLTAAAELRAAYDRGDPPTKKKKSKRKQVAKPKPARPVVSNVVDTRAVIQAYGKRNAILADMGFASYSEYLASPLWSSIRARALAGGARCFGCGSAARQVHHGVYDRQTLTGKNDRHLFAICRRCHKWIEFTEDGKKRTPKAATKALRTLGEFNRSANSRAR